MSAALLNWWPWRRERRAAGAVSTSRASPSAPPPARRGRGGADAGVPQRSPEDLLRAAHAVALALDESKTVAEAAPKILGAIGALGWDFGAMWLVDPPADSVRCVDVWRAEPGVGAALEAESRRRTFPRGAGLPGKVWEEGGPIWIEDVALDDRVAR